jgi:hypothetical protein
MMLWLINGNGSSLRIFQKLLGFRIVFCFDLLIVKEVLFVACVLVYLEAVIVEVVFALPAANVGDCYVERLRWTFVCLGTADSRKNLYFY